MKNKTKFMSDVLKPESPINIPTESIPIIDVYDDENNPESLYNIIKQEEMIEMCQEFSKVIDDNF